MRISNKISVCKGDVCVTCGANGGVISTVIVTDSRASTQPQCLEGGAKCRDATPSEIKTASESGKIRNIYCS